MKYRLFANAFLGLFISLGASAQDKKEKQFHNIYKKFNEQPTDTVLWNQVVDKTSSKVYQVQDGDTLWEISQTLFADPQFWPKVWAVNNDFIGNPHQVFPGQQIQFVPGTLGRPPSISVAGAGAPSAATTPAGATPQAEVKKVSPPPPDLPGSLPSWGYKPVMPNGPTDFAVLPRPRDLASAETALNYVLKSQVSDSAGKIVETEMGLSSAAEFQYVVVSLERGEPGVYTVVKAVQEITHPRTGRRYQMVQVQGQVKVESRVNDRQNLYRAVVTRSLNPVEVGSHLVPGDMPTYDLKNSGSSVEASAEIIGGSLAAGQRRLFGSDEIVFLSAGRNQGLQAGSVLPIFRNPRVKVESSSEQKSHRRIGSIMIVESEDEVATGVVMSSSEEVSVGDFTSPAL